MQNNLWKEKNDEIKIYLVYIILFFIFVFKTFFYANQNFDTPDWKAQIAYVTYAELHPEMWIPEYADIPTYSIAQTIVEDGQIIYRLRDNGSTCYLGHPVLYYKLMGMFDNVEEDEQGNIYLNYTRLRLCNVFLTSFTMLLALLGGYIALNKRDAEWYLHFLYAAIATSLPMYGFVGSGVNNDNLANLGCVLLFLGVLNYTEEEYNYKTFWLVALGLSIAVLSKLNVGLMVLLVAFIVIFIDAIRTKRLSIIFNKYFATTLPIYAVVLHYFLSIYQKYGSFHVAYAQYAPEEYWNTHFYVEPGTGEMITFWEDVKHFFGGLYTTWASTYDSSFSVRRDGWNSMAYAIILILFLIAMIIEMKEYVKCNAKTRNIATLSFGVSIIIVMIFQFSTHYASHSVGSYSGGVQGRYYMSCIPIIAFSVTKLVDYIENKCSRLSKIIIKTVAILMAVWIVYLDFFYFVANVYAIL